MKNSKKTANLLILAAVVQAICIIVLSFAAVSMRPILLSSPAEAEPMVRKTMDAVTQGDFDTVSANLQGTPDLGVHREPQDVVGRLLWEAFLESFTYEIQGPCYGDESGIAMDLSVSYLDFNSVIATLGDRAETMLEKRVKSAKSSDEIFDRNQNYREEVIEQVLKQATEAGLKKDAKTVTGSLTLHMVYEQGRWWVVPTESLMRVLSGGTAK